MTGAEHYREAERLLADVQESRNHPDAAAPWIALAQAHATLALAAATAYPAIRDYCGDESTDSREWTSAVSS